MSTSYATILQRLCRDYTNHRMPFDEYRTRRKAVLEKVDEQFNGVYGPLVGMDVKGGTQAGKKIAESLKMFYHVAHIGDVRSMVIHPASTTHSQIPSEDRAKAGITDGYVRLCIGIENADDIIADLSQALDQI